MRADTATTIFTARHIVTLQRGTPSATAVAVRDGRILAVGSQEDCERWGPATVDDRFADYVLIPGFVEAHGHTMDALAQAVPYVGRFPFPLADGTVAPAVDGYDALLRRLREVDAALAPGETLLAFGFDPIHFPHEPRLDRHHLDRVSTTRPIYVGHASGHLATVNSALLAAEGITRELTTPGVVRDGAGEPNGELQEPAAMGLARTARRRLGALTQDVGQLRVHARMCRNAGVTTATELGGMMLLTPSLIERWHTVADDDDFPVRMIVYNLAGLPGTVADPAAVAAAATALRDRDTDKLRTGGVKLLLDGSIQGWTAMLQWPGYLTGTDHGQLLIAPEQLGPLVAALHRARVNIHAHCNGNLATEVFLDAVEDALCDYAWLDHRHTVQHSQTSTPAQYRRMGRLGMCANIFTNHIWHWGDAHAERTMGPDRARGMWACRTALASGVPLSFHTDSGVTPIGHLSTMWCAVNRTTPSGRVLGPDEALTPAEALHAATLGAAYQLHLDHEIGSIEAGKRADFAVLGASPLEVDPMELREIPVWGTVLGGVPFEAERPR
jgi:predicted amidohydrolase YtcJ